MEPTRVSGVVANIRKVQAIIRWDSWEQDGFEKLFFLSSSIRIMDMR